MTNEEFDAWVIRYRKVFLRPDEDYEILLLWMPKILPLHVEDAMAAILDVASDERKDARFNQSRLPLLLEYARDHRQERENAEQMHRIAQDEAPFREARTQP